MVFDVVQLCGSHFRQKPCRIAINKQSNQQTILTSHTGSPRHLSFPLQNHRQSPASFPSFHRQLSHLSRASHSIDIAAVAAPPLHLLAEERTTISFAVIKRTSVPDPNDEPVFTQEIDGASMACHTCARIKGLDQFQPKQGKK